MDDLHGLDDFRAILAADGWRIARNNMLGEHNACNWYAWSAKRITGPDCRCNDRPPSLMIWPHLFDGSIKVPVNPGTYELEICGEAPGGIWLKLRAYSLSPNKFKAEFPNASRRLTVAWRAAAKG